MELDMEHGIHFCVCVRVRGACDHRCVCDGVISSRSLLYVLACRSMVLVRILSLFSLHIRPRVHARTRTYTYTYALTRTYVPVLTQAQHTRKKEPLYSALFCSALLCSTLLYTMLCSALFCSALLSLSRLSCFDFSLSGFFSALCRYMCGSSMHKKCHV